MGRSEDRRPRRDKDQARYEAACAIARERGGRLLSKSVQHCMEKVLWQCAKGHQWWAIADSVRAGRWCPECCKHSIEDMRLLAAKRGGKCLSNEYVNSDTPLEWQCAKHHTWWSRPKIIRYHWCPFCARVRKLDLKELRHVAGMKGGQLLSRSYVDSNTHLLWRCANGHTWWARAASVKPGKYRLGTWCRRCAILSSRGRKKEILTIDDMHGVARQRGGKCLSDSYVNYTTKLTWQCGRGHEWMATPSSVLMGSWCPACGRQHLDFKQVMARAAKQGGRVLSRESEYVDSKSVLEWRCAAGHRWKATVHTIRTGAWCVQCSSRRPLTMKDMRDIAREQGGQCLSKYYVNSTTPLRWKCAMGHVWEATPHQVRPTRYGRGQWCPVCAGAPKYGVEDMREFARARGGECLSRTAGKLTIPLRWRCAQGHTWEAPPHAIIIKGNWCPTCARERRRLTIETMQRLAQSKGGECLSREYVNNCTPLRWQCAQGHRFLRTPAAMQLRGGLEADRWCPVCSSNRPPLHSLEEMRALAKSRGGACLSETAGTVNTPLLWRCATGHVWKAPPARVILGNWCRRCANDRHKLSIEAMQVLARERGGECLSESYVNYKTPLQWRCANGHVFRKKPGDVRRQPPRWCAQCAGQSKAAAGPLPRTASARLNAFRTSDSS